MGGGLMQLVAYGAQDIYLTGQPQITFFKSVYRRHTNFAVESILQTINGTPGVGSRVSVTISRNGDLLKNLWIQYNPSQIITSNASVLGCDFGHALFDQLEIEIGGQVIDRHYGKWLTIWRNLTEVNPTGAHSRLHWSGQEPPFPDGMNDGNQVIREGWELPTKYQKMSFTHKGYPTEYGNSGYAPRAAYVPMCFWFCKNPGLAVPLIALQYHEVKFNITFAPIVNFALGDEGSPVVNFSSINVYADYVYLDTTERRQFAQNAHEYLIDQLQLQNDSATGGTVRLNFNHPVKELIWTGKPGPVTNDGYWGTQLCVTGGATPLPIVGNVSTNYNHDQPAQLNLTAKLVLNGTDRFTERHLTYFTRNQIWECHTGFGATANLDSVAVYSFALRPEEHQPSGTCNFSRIDTAQLVFNGSNVGDLKALDIYAVNYNVLRIMSGMGGLAYSN